MNLYIITAVSEQYPVAYILNDSEEGALAIYRQRSNARILKIETRPLDNNVDKIVVVPNTANPAAAVSITSIGLESNTSGDGSPSFGGLLFIDSFISPTNNNGVLGFECHFQDYPGSNLDQIELQASLDGNSWDSVFAQAKIAGHAGNFSLSIAVDDASLASFVGNWTYFRLLDVQHPTIFSYAIVVLI